MKSKKSEKGIIFGIFIIIFLFVGILASHSIPTEITIQNSGFNPQEVIIGPGTVTWINADTKTHRVLSDDGLFDSGNLTPGQSYSHYFNEVRAYHYHDAMNSSMKGSLELPMSTVG